MAWRIFALVATCMACAVYIVGQAPPVARWLAKVNLLPPSMTTWAKPDTPLTKLEVYLPISAFGVYVIARLGILALILSSLRALPVDSYKSIDWLASVPHI